MIAPAQTGGMPNVQSGLRNLQYPSADVSANKKLSFVRHFPDIGKTLLRKSLNSIR
jgi:hypothetical protein